MKNLYHILRLPPNAPARLRPAHHLWMSLALTGLGCCIGLLTLVFTAYTSLALDARLLLDRFLRKPLLLAVNCLFPVLLIWLFYFLFRRAWAAYSCAFLVTVGIAAVNYFKVRLRTDPLLAADLRLAAEAGNIVGGYELELNNLIWAALGCYFAGLLFTLLLMPRGLRGLELRCFGAASCLALIAVALAGPFSSVRVYWLINNNDLVNQWSPTENYVSRGCVYSFLHSAGDLFPHPPEGYSRDRGAAALAAYPDSDIPPERQVSVAGFMLEAFCDMTDFSALSGVEGVRRLYEPWHALEERSVSGDLLTNIFAAGTSNTEWAFVAGYSNHEDFRAPAGSYAWYLRSQGYQTFGSHPGYAWFYNRQNVNEYLGFQDYRFLENYYGEYMDAVAAVCNSDSFLLGAELDYLEERIKEGPCFSFSVTYQNHGPYESDRARGAVFLTPEETGLSLESCAILNNYFDGILRTIQAVEEAVQRLEEMEEPVVLVLFGDHKPWSGNGNSVYQELGLDFDLSTLEGFYDYYSTPYLIWANPAAKEVLGREFLGDGGDFSPCFLMAEVFDQCGWEGPGFMKLSREMREATPLVHKTDRFLKDGQLADALEGEDLELFQRFLWAQYYREHEFKP